MHGVALRCGASFFVPELRCFVVLKIHIMMWCACGKVGRILDGGYTGKDGMG